MKIRKTPKVTTIDNQVRDPIYSTKKIVGKQEPKMPKAVNYKANSIVYFRGDVSEKVYILKSGKVSLNYNDIETGQEMHDLIQTGEFFGVKSALGKYPREETAVVLADATMISFTVPEFEQVALQNTRIIIKMLRVFSNHSGVYISRCGIFCKRSKHE